MIMIAVQEAKELIIDNCQPLPSIELSLTDARGHILSKDIFSEIEMPLFDQSAMDGYAININENNQYRILGEIPAGSSVSYTLNKGEAVRIYTGAKIPEGANAVIMQEKTEVENETLTCQTTPKEGENIRVKGEQIKKGELALKKGQYLNAASMGFLASLGITDIQAYKKPVVSIIITGDELKVTGTALTEGKIFESNSIMLKSALQAVGINEIDVQISGDQEQVLTEIIQNAIEASDIILITGGISVGKYDFTGRALANSGIENIFYKIYQKPGKPLFFGKTPKNKPIFALPGNPAAALSCFYEYVYPALCKMQNRTVQELLRISLPIKEDYHKKGEMAHFLKGYADANGVNILEGQGSHMLRSFAVSNCLIYIPSEKQYVEKNEMVEVHLLPNL
jgi:molybdopterin molybdotransferase